MSCCESHTCSMAARISERSPANCRDKSSIRMGCGMGGSIPAGMVHGQMAAGAGARCRLQGSGSGGVSGLNVCCESKDLEAPWVLPLTRP